MVSRPPHGTNTELTTPRVNQKGEFVYVKYHFLADGGQKQFTRQEAVEMSGINPDYSKQDLWQAVENGEPISYTAYVQVMQPDEADPAKLGFDPFDVTKVWPRGAFPVRSPFVFSLSLTNCFLRYHMIHGRC